jgi:hypothetical protein
VDGHGRDHDHCFALREQDGGHCFSLRERGDGQRRHETIRYARPFPGTRVLAAFIGIIITADIHHFDFAAFVFQFIVHAFLHQRCASAQIT